MSILSDTKSAPQGISRAELFDVPRGLRNVGQKVFYSSDAVCAGLLYVCRRAPGSAYSFDAKPRL